MTIIKTSRLELTGMQRIELGRQMLNKELHLFSIRYRKGSSRYNWAIVSSESAGLAISKFTNNGRNYYWIECVKHELELEVEMEDFYKDYVKKRS